MSDYGFPIAKAAAARRKQGPSDDGLDYYKNKMSTSTGAAVIVNASQLQGIADGPLFKKWLISKTQDLDRTRDQFAREKIATEIAIARAFKADSLPRDLIGTVSVFKGRIYQLDDHGTKVPIPDVIIDTDPGEYLEPDTSQAEAISETRRQEEWERIAAADEKRREYEQTRRGDGNMGVTR